MSRARIQDGYFVGSMMIPSRVGKVDLGLIARGLLSGVQARQTSATTWEVTSSNRFLRGPYACEVTGEQVTCRCPAGAHGQPCVHAALVRLLAATITTEETP